jgi:hypothetical protein
MCFATFEDNHLLFKFSQHRLPNATITIVLSIIYAITYGCVTIPTTEPPSPEIRRQLGRIGIVALSSPIQGEFHTQEFKGKTAGALSGATFGAVGGAVGVWAGISWAAGTALTPAAIISAASVPGYGIPLLIVLGAGALMVFYATGKGAADGAARAVPEEAAKQIEQQISDFLMNMKLSSGLAEAIYAAGASKPSLAKNPITLLGEINSEENISYDNFSSQGIKTILEVSVAEIGFQEMHRPPPDPLVWEETSDYPIRFYMWARTRFVKAANDTVLYTRNFQYQSSYRPLITWLDNSRQKLELEFKHAQANLAKQIIHELFLTSTIDVASNDDSTRISNERSQSFTARKYQDPKEYKAANETASAEKEKPKLASIPKSVTLPRISLRSQPMEISNEMQITKMLKRYGFFESTKNIYGSFNNHFVDNKDGTVTDKSTGLMWQKSGTLNSLEYKEAKKHIGHLNIERFAGYSDWRLPNVEQLASLLEKEKINGVHLDPVFSNRQVTCWTVDEREVTSQYNKGTWVVNFKQGQILIARFQIMHSGSASWGANSPINAINYVKAVRQVK